MRDRYTATICHHTIGRARVEGVGNDLEQAKKLADQEFGDGFLDHTIVIYDRNNYGPAVAWRRIGDDEWSEE